MLRLAALALAVSMLAGCAGEPPTLGPFPPTGTPTPPTALAPLVESGLASFSFSIDAARPAANASFVIPGGVAKAVLNVTLLGGAAVNLIARTSSCSLVLGGPLPADGRTFSEDCGGLQAGNDTLVVEQSAGAVHGFVELTALVCLQQPHTRCP